MNVPDFIGGVFTLSIRNELEANIANITKQVFMIPDSFQYLNLVRISLELFSRSMGIEIEKHVMLKLQWNSLRKKYHAKKY